jgi:hypothetical protein
MCEDIAANVFLFPLHELNVREHAIGFVPGSQFG